MILMIGYRSKTVALSSSNLPNPISLTYKRNLYVFHNAYYSHYVILVIIIIRAFILLFLFLLSLLLFFLSQTNEILQVTETPKFSPKS